MRIEFVVMPEARSDLLALLRPRSRSTLDAVLRAQIIVEDVEVQLQKEGEPPIGARIVRSGKHCYWWLYIEGIWLGFHRVDIRSRLFKLRTRTVTFHSALASLPRV